MLTLFKKREAKSPAVTKIWLGRPKEHRPRRNIEKKNTLLLTKRRRFVIVAIALAVALFLIQNLAVESRYLAILVLAFLAYGLSGWALYKDLRGVEWFSILILPTLYPVSVGLFYFLLPEELTVRIIVTGLFAVSVYALLLTANIFAVASIRTIQLLRAARAVGFLLTVLTSALLYHVIFALRLPVIFGSALVFITSFLIFYQGIWSHTLGLRPDKRELSYAIVGSLVLFEASLAISFWLLDVALASIMLAMMLYVVLGLFQQDLEQRLFSRTLQEYLGFAGIVFVVITATAMWRWMN